MDELLKTQQELIKLQSELIIKQQNELKELKYKMIFLLNPSKITIENNEEAGE